MSTFAYNYNIMWTIYLL